MKDDRVYLKHILRCIARIREYTVGDRESFFASPLIQDGVIRNLQTLAESSQHLSEGIKAAHSSVDWKGLAGSPAIARNRRHTSCPRRWRPHRC